MANWYILWPFGIFCGRFLYILWPFGIFYGQMVYFKAIWYILWSFGIFFPFWYVVHTEKNLATLM
jgi:hypothetical protein